MGESCLEQLRKMSIIVADSGDFEAVKKFKPQESTTNPTLLLQACEQERYRDLISGALKKVKEEGGQGCLVNKAVDELYVTFASELLKIVPGRVSVEIDADMSFDTCASLAKTYHMLDLFKSRGVSSDRILIKLASTWEGLQTCRVLEGQHIHCNMTLMFHLSQAAAAAQNAGATVISPFVGRIMDWYVKNGDQKTFTRTTDPGVVSVCQIYNYLKRVGASTNILAASFRNTDEILGLSGCDLLTIAPSLLDKLATMNEPVVRVLDPQTARSSTEPLPKVGLDEKTFRWLMNEDAMATEKMSEGIRRFAADNCKLKKVVAGLLEKV